MGIPVVKFNEKDQPEFFREAKKRVNAYFKEKNLSRNANMNMYFKTAFMLALYLVPLTLMVTGVIASAWGTIGMWALMGFGVAGIGLSIMHDANHGSYSKNLKVNRIIGSVLYLAGGYPLNWRIQHNVLHHSFTNIDGLDEDIEKQGIVRFSPTQPRRKFFKFQILYAPLLYGILTLYWSTVKDYEQILRYHKRGLLEAQGVTFRKAILRIVFNKLAYYAVFIALPIIFAPAAVWVTILGYLLMQFIAGMALALIFQAAHVLEETEFYHLDEKNSVENNWAIHQMKTTANFANRSVLFSWYVGGLNYQVEHHLFPNICHVHYRKIAPIVKATAEEFGVPYLAHKTFIGALKSHFKLIHSLGTGKYDEKLKNKETAKAA
ncbi:MAG: linoleoyl-CoA desaturase [Flavobacteriaceae bacterium]|jgi:linoleoyl-CoA desaturase